MESVPPMFNRNLLHGHWSQGIKKRESVQVGAACACLATRCFQFASAEACHEGKVQMCTGWLNRSTRKKTMMRMTDTIPDISIVSGFELSKFYQIVIKVVSAWHVQLPIAPGFFEFWYSTLLVFGIYRVHQFPALGSYGGNDHGTMAPWHFFHP